MSTKIAYFFFSLALTILVVRGQGANSNDDKKEPEFDQKGTIATTMEHAIVVAKGVRGLVNDIQEDKGFRAKHVLKFALAVEPSIPYIGQLFAFAAALFSGSETDSNAEGKLIKDVFRNMSYELAKTDSQLKSLVAQLSIKAVQFQNAYTEQYNNLKKVDHAYKEYLSDDRKYSVGITLYNTCESNSPSDFMNWLNDVFIEEPNLGGENFMEAILRNVNNDESEFNKWANTITLDFVKAMMLNQVCLGLRLVPNYVCPGGDNGCPQLPNFKQSVRAHMKESAEKQMEIMKKMANLFQEKSDQLKGK